MCTINTHALSLPGGERPALMIIHFLRTFHSLRNTSNYVWSLSFLSHRMSWNTRLRSLISRQPGGAPTALELEQEGNPGPQHRDPGKPSPELHVLTCGGERARPVSTLRCHWEDSITWRIAMSSSPPVAQRVVTASHDGSEKPEAEEAYLPALPFSFLV